jgi:hypothetical protein
LEYTITNELSYTHSYLEEFCVPVSMLAWASAAATRKNKALLYVHLSQYE